MGKLYIKEGKQLIKKEKKYSVLIIIWCRGWGSGLKWSFSQIFLKSYVEIFLCPRNVHEDISIVEFSTSFEISEVFLIYSV